MLDPLEVLKGGQLLFCSRWGYSISGRGSGSPALSPRFPFSPFSQASSREPYPLLQGFCERMAEPLEELGREGAGCHGSSFSWTPCSFLLLSGVLTHEPLSPLGQEPCWGAHAACFRPEKIRCLAGPVPVHLGMSFSLFQKKSSFQRRNVAGDVGGNLITASPEGERCIGLALALAQVTYGINWAGRRCYFLTKPSVCNVAPVCNLRGSCGWR